MTCKQYTAVTGAAAAYCCRYIWFHRYTGINEVITNNRVHQHNTVIYSAAVGLILGDVQHNIIYPLYTTCVLYASRVLDLDKNACAIMLRVRTARIYWLELRGSLLLEIHTTRSFYILFHCCIRGKKNTPEECAYV